MVSNPVRGHAPAAFASLWLAACLSAMAQPATPRPDPLDARAAVPAPDYRSSLAAYRRAGEAPPVGWREANDNVTRIGGWRAYTREAQQPEAAGSAAHGAHHGHTRP
jgi:hypothetical protein